MNGECPEQEMLVELAQDVVHHVVNLVRINGRGDDVQPILVSLAFAADCRNVRFLSLCSLTVSQRLEPDPASSPSPIRDVNLINKEASRRRRCFS